jgi:hypothetical protein
MRQEKDRSKVISLLVVACILLAAACDDTDTVIGTTPAVVQGNGIVVEQSRPVGSFGRLDMHGIGVVTLRQGANEELVVRAEENLLPYLETEVQAGELVIWKKNATLLNTQPIEYDLTVVDLDRIALTGAGNVQGANHDLGSLELVMPGVGTVDLANLEATTLDAESSGVGELILSGAVQQQSITLKGMGGYDGRDLDSLEAQVTIQLGGSATVRVSDHLSVTIRGSGSVYYIGDPVVDSQITGSGKVEQI